MGEVEQREEDYAKLCADHNWSDVKYANDRENKVADQMIATEIQAAAIFIALSGVLLGKAVGADRVFLVVAILLFAISIILGIFGFYRKELFWRDSAAENHLISKEWAEVWRRKSTPEHVAKILQITRGGNSRNQSPVWPVIVQTSFFFLGLIVAFIGLVKTTF